MYTVKLLIKHSTLNRFYIRGYILFLIVITIAGFPSIHATGQNYQENYAYLVINADGAVDIRVVDPQNPAQATSLMYIPANQGASFSTGFLSPKGDKILLEVFSDQQVSLRMFDLATRQSTTIIK